MKRAKRVELICVAANWYQRKVGRLGSKVSRASRGYLQDEAEVGGRSVLLFVVFGVVDVQLVKADEAGEVSRALQDRQVEKQA